MREVVESARIMGTNFRGDKHILHTPGVYVDPLCQLHPRSLYEDDAPCAAVLASRLCSLGVPPSDGCEKSAMQPWQSRLLIKLEEIVFHTAC